LILSVAGFFGGI
jgi:uncharacterized protein YjbJ (UPF0337 family)